MPRGWRWPSWWCLRSPVTSYRGRWCACLARTRASSRSGPSTCASYRSTTSRRASWSPATFHNGLRFTGARSHAGLLAVRCTRLHVRPNSDAVIPGARCRADRQCPRRGERRTRLGGGDPPRPGFYFLFVPAGTVHSAKNVGTSNGAELATYVVEKGKPLITLAPCYGDRHERIHHSHGLIHQREHHPRVLGTPVALERHQLRRLRHHRVRHLRLSAAGRRTGRRTRGVLRRPSHADPDRCGVLRPECPQPHVVRGGAQDHLGGCGAGRLGRGSDRLERSGRRTVSRPPHGKRSPRVLDRRLRKSDAHIGTE